MDPNYFSFTEITGYAASISVLLSFLMKEIKMLRIVNTIGCALFVVYGFLLWSWPIILTNLAIIGINFYYLFLIKPVANNK